MLKLSIFIVILAVALYSVRYYMQGSDCEYLSTLSATERASLLKGKVALITGANTGIGKETAIGLAQLGARVIIACRDQTRGAEALEEIRLRSNSTEVELMKLDLSDVTSIRSFVAEYKSRDLPLHILVANAGVGVFFERQETKNGFEINMGVNHLGHFELVTSLLDVVKSSASSASPARIVMLSSDAHYFSKLNLDDLNLENESGFSANSVAYGNSKLANIMFAKELQNRLNGQGYAGKIAVFAVHPGFVASDFGRHIPSLAQYPFHILEKMVAKSSKRGAQPSICLAAAPEFLKSGAGQYFDHFIRPSQPHSMALDERATARLWELSEELLAGAE